MAHSKAGKGNVQAKCKISCNRKKTCYQKMRYLETNLTKEVTKVVQDLYIKNYKTLLKEIRAALNKWKHILCSWNQILNIIKKATFPKLMKRFSTIYT